MEAEAGKVGDSCRLVEHVQVPKRELLGDLFCYLESSLVAGLVVAELDRPGADLSFDGENDSLWASGDLNSL